MKSSEIEIINKLGLHARAATRLVECANQFDSKVWLKKDDKHVDGKSIMGLLTLAAGPGMELEIETVGPDADSALAALSELIDSGFGEPEL